MFVYDVDDLQEVAEDNLASRSREAQQAERIIQAEVVEFEQWRRTQQLAPTIVALREHFLGTVEAELRRSMPEADRATLERMSLLTVNKLLHHPITRLKSGATTPDGSALIDAIQQLFKLDAPPHDPEVGALAHAPKGLPTSSGDKS